MPKAESGGLVIHYDRVHIITVSGLRREARLFENGGAGDGTLIFKSDEPAAKAPVTDAMQLIDLALRFGVSYDLLSRVADAEVLKIFERLGVKDFLDKMLALTTEQERHQRFDGFEFTFMQAMQEQPPPIPDEAPATNGKATNGSARKKVATV
jgi:hypothetical protein